MLSTNSDKVCIIIPHLNEKQMILDLLDSIEKITQFTDYFVVVVDNGSKDGSVSAIRNKFPQVKLICNKTNLGFPKAINQAIMAYPAKYYFLLNNDTVIVQPYWLKTIVKIMEENPTLGILGTTQISPDDASNFLQKIEKKGISEKILFTKFVCYGQVLIRSEVFSTVSLLDEDYSPAYVEDLDHCQRSMKKGWKLAIIPSIRITHIGMVTSAKLKSNKAYLKLRNTLLYITYNFNLFRFLIKISNMYFKMLYISLRIRKRHSLLIVTPWIIWFFLKNIFRIIKKRIYRLQNPTYIKPISFR